MKSVRYLISQSLLSRLVGLLAAAAFCLAIPNYAQAAAQDAAKNVTTYRQTMKASDFANLPETHMIDFGNRKVSVKYLNNLTKAAKILRAPRVDRTPANLRVKNTGVPVMTVGSSADLATALNRQPSDIVKLKSGRTVPVGWLQYVQPLAEKRAGRSQEKTSKRPNLTGEAIQVSSKTELKKYLDKPDSTVLESKNSKIRITVGELNQAMKTGKVTLPAAKGKPVRPINAVPGASRPGVTK